MPSLMQLPAIKRRNEGGRRDKNKSWGLIISLEKGSDARVEIVHMSLQKRPFHVLITATLAQLLC